MAGKAASYVQGRLFDEAETAGSPAARPHAVRHGGHPVTRDPAVALAYAEACSYSHGIKLGLARILAARSPEERAAIRALLAKSHVA